MTPNSRNTRQWRVWGAALVMGLASPGWVNAQVVAAVPEVPRAATQHNAPATGPGVNINTASTAELMFLPGIGQKKAEAIVARRDKKKFVRSEELMDIKGIGRGIYKRLKPFVRTAGETTASGKLSGRAGT